VPELQPLLERLTADRKVRALAAAGSDGTPAAWSGSVPTLLSFERGLLSPHSELRAGVQQERYPFELLDAWRNPAVALAQAPLALLASCRVSYDPTGLLGRAQRTLLGLSQGELTAYREGQLAQAEERLAGAEAGLRAGGGATGQISALVTAREVALEELYPALLSRLHLWPEFEIRLPHAWRAAAGLPFPRSVYHLERLYAFGGEEEARRCLLATRGLGLLEQEKRARAAHAAGYFDGAVRLLRDEAARTHAHDLPRWENLSDARREKLSTLIGVSRSPLGPTALGVARELLEAVRAGR